ncbi:hypothetical protein F66182_11828, partial [Fusarium sp. NRRL 66182]
LLLLELADSPILPFDLEAYSTEFRGYIDNLQEYAVSKGVPLKTAPDTPQARTETVDLKPLYDASEVFKTNAANFQAWEQVWYSAVYGSGGFESNIMGARRIDHNNRLAKFETNLLDLSQGGGVPNRTQFKHVLFAPQTWSGYDEAFFPAIRDAIDAGDWNATQLWVNRVADIVTQASVNLNI